MLVMLKRGRKVAQDVELTRTPSQNLILTLSQNPQDLTCSEMTTHIAAGVPVATVSTCKEQVLKKRDFFKYQLHVLWETSCNSK